MEINKRKKKKKTEIFFPSPLLKRLSFFRNERRLRNESYPPFTSFEKKFPCYNKKKILKAQLFNIKLTSLSLKSFHFSFNTPSSQHLIILCFASFLLLSQILFQSYNSILPTSLTNILLLNQRLLT